MLCREVSIFSDVQNLPICCPLVLPTDDNLRRILFCGDQLTVERARGCQEARVNSDSTKEALLGLEPAIADWHAEANFLQVSKREMVPKLKLIWLIYIVCMCTYPTPMRP